MKISKSEEFHFLLSLGRVLKNLLIVLDEDHLNRALVTLF